MATPVMDPKNPATKPRGTTKDQITEMESEGPGAASDQDIDIAGTEADDYRPAHPDTNQRPQRQKVEVPGDTDEAP